MAGRDHLVAAAKLIAISRPEPQTHSTIRTQHGERNRVGPVESRQAPQRSRTHPGS
jgi:hypothetical protein